MTEPALETSYAACRAVVRAASSNFALSFRLLNPDERAGMNALYAFMRLTDDLTDEPAPAADQRAILADWRSATAAALAGKFSHPIHPALHHTVTTFGVDPQHLDDVITGVAADLESVAFASFDELYPYCYRVASAVGLACLPVWGCNDPAARPLGEAAGIAFQLTNILRDLGEDRALGRVYLPADELIRFDAPPDRWSPTDANFSRLMAFQIGRAKDFYQTARGLSEYLPRRGRAVWRVMFGTYAALLQSIEDRRYDVFTARVRVPKWRKAALFARAWAGRLVDRP